MDKKISRHLPLPFSLPNPNSWTIIVIIGLSLSLCVITNLLPLYLCTVYLRRVSKNFIRRICFSIPFHSVSLCSIRYLFRTLNTSVSNLINSIFHCNIGCQRIKVCWTFSMLKIRSPPAPYLAVVIEAKEKKIKNFSNVSVCSWKILCAILSIFSCT